MVIPYTPVWSPNKPGKSNRWWFYSPSLRRMVFLGRELHYERCLAYEFGAVATYCEYPLEVTAFVQGRCVRTLFDFWTCSADGSSAYETITYKDDLADCGAQERREIAAKARWCERHGYKHVVVTGGSIRSIPMLAANRRRILGNYNSRCHHATRSLAIKAASLAVVTALRTAGSGLRFSALVELVSLSHSTEDARIAVFDHIRSGMADAQFGSRLFDRGTIISLNEPAKH
jgi:hypothetical protein